MKIPKMVRVKRVVIHGGRVMICRAKRGGLWPRDAKCWLCLSRKKNDNNTAITIKKG